MRNLCKMIKASTLVVILAFYIVITASHEPRKIKLQLKVLAIAENRYAAREFRTRFEAQQTFCEIFEEVQTHFDRITQRHPVNITIQFAGVRLNRRRNKQPYFEDNLWEHKGELYYKEDAVAKMWKYANQQTFGNRYDLVILFTRKKLAVQTFNGKLLLIPGGHRVSLFCCECDQPNVAILKPRPKAVANELAYLLGAHEDLYIKHNPSKFQNCAKKNQTKFGPFSKCAISGILERSRSSIMDCYRKNRIPMAYDCEKILDEN